VKFKGIAKVATSVDGRRFLDTFEERAIRNL